MVIRFNRLSLWKLLWAQAGNGPPYSDGQSISGAQTRSVNQYFYTPVTPNDTWITATFSSYLSRPAPYHLLDLLQVVLSRGFGKEPQVSLRNFFPFPSLIVTSIRCMVAIAALPTSL